MGIFILEHKYFPLDIRGMLFLKSFATLDNRKTIFASHSNTDSDKNLLNAASGDVGVSGVSQTAYHTRNNENGSAS